MTVGRGLRQRLKRLMERDPWGLDLTRSLQKLYREPPESQETAELWKTCNDLKTKLEGNYNVPIHLLEPEQARQFMAAGRSLDWVLDGSWVPMQRPIGAPDPGRPMTASANWILPHGNRTILPILTRRRPVRRQLRTIDGRPPTVTFTVDEEELALWDLRRLRRLFKQYLREALEGLPKELRKTCTQQSPSHRMAPVPHSAGRFTYELELVGVALRDSGRLAAKFQDQVGRVLLRLRGFPGQPSSRLAWIRLASNEKFTRDLRRYDLYIRDGLSFAEIARRELRQRRAQAVAQNRVRPGARSGSSGEDGVRKSVYRIHSTIYGGRPEKYCCPFHPENECRPSCLYRRGWLARARRHASDSTGHLSGEGKEDRFESEMEYDVSSCPAHGDDCDPTCPDRVSSWAAAHMTHSRGRKPFRRPQT